MIINLLLGTYIYNIFIFVRSPLHEYKHLVIIFEQVMLHFFWVSWLYSMDTNELMDT